MSLVGQLLGEEDLGAELIGGGMILLVVIVLLVIRTTRSRSTMIRAPVFAGMGARARQRHRQILANLLDPGETLIATASAIHHAPREELLLGDFAHLRMKTYILAASTRRMFVLEELVGGANPIWNVPLSQVTLHKFKSGLLGTTMSLEQHGQKLHVKTIFGYGQAAEAMRGAIIGANKGAESDSG